MEMAATTRFVSLIDVLRRRALEEAERVAYVFLQSGDSEQADEVKLSYRAIWERAAAVAGQVAATTAPGDRVLLLLPTGSEFLAAFLGCLACGRIAVPCAPPVGDRAAEKIALVGRDCGAALALLPSRLSAASTAWRETLAVPTAQVATTSEVKAPEVLVAARPDDVAFLQYTSGSTGSPRGVVVSHGNLMANQAMIGHAFRSRATDVGLGWLPLHHDMGLIGKALHPLYVGMPIVLMTPGSFLQRPLKWLRAISDFRATISGAPDFAYSLCVKRFTPAAAEGLDLSSWRVAFTGAEPIRRATLRDFAACFAPYGFDARSFLPCYGLAEATLIVSGGAREGEPEVVALDGGEKVACGEIVPGVDVVVVDPETSRPVDDGQVGEIWVRGPSVASGYWNAAEQSALTFGASLSCGEGPYLRTGDLGVFASGELVVTGRLKDLLIIAGKNHYPQDLEATGVAAARAAAGAAFGVEGPHGGEALVLLVEVDRSVVRAGPDELRERLQGARVAVAREHGITPFDVVLVRPGALPRTTSGKLRRGACRAAYESGSGDLGVLASLREAQEASAVA